MIKIVKVPIKPGKQQIEDQKISSQFHYIKELSLMKYDAEEKRELDGSDILLAAQFIHTPCKHEQVDDKISQYTAVERQSEAVDEEQLERLSHLDKTRHKSEEDKRDDGK